MAVFGAIFVITRRNLITAVMGMVGTFFALAGLYVMLYAHFLAVIQILVYAGAIMVLFVFVVMILNRPVDDPWALTGLFGKGLAIVALGYLLFRIGSVLWGFGSTRGSGSWSRITAALPSLTWRLSLSRQDCLGLK